jgi:hypothetical protein
MLILLRVEVLLVAAFWPESGLHEVNNKPAPAAAEAPMNSRRVMGCVTIF